MDSFNTEKLNTKKLQPITWNLDYGWRLLATAFSFALFGAGTLVLGSVFHLARLIPIQQSSKQLWIRRSISKGCRFYIKIMQWMGLLTFAFGGQQVLAKKLHQQTGNLLIANHPTLLDAVFLLSLHSNLCCITKTSLARNPFTASIISMAGYLRNDDAGFIEQARHKLARGETLLIFPEGTRSSHGYNLQFKRGAANIGILTGCHIVPVIIQCTPPTLQKGKPWYCIPDKAPHFTLSAGEVIIPASHVNSAKPVTIQYRQLTVALQKIYRTYLNRLSDLNGKVNSEEMMGSKP